MSDIELDELTKIYDDAQGTETAVDGVSLHVEDGEFLVIVGPSGCGKSTTLRMIAGLETTTDGEIRFDGSLVQHLAASERSVAMAFQNFALYRKMTVAENLEYGLKHSTYMTREQRRDRVETIAETLEISDLFDHYPDEISGGQKQRVALGRAVVRDPEVFLLDEPLSNLDAKLRATLRTELKRIHDEFGVTTVYVTHDQKEAMALADRIAVMRDGTIQQIDSPEATYHHPANRFVATFIGSPSMNILPVQRQRDGDEVSLLYDGTELVHLPADSVPETPETVELGFRFDEIRIHQDPTDGHFEAEVRVNEYQGNERYIYVPMSEENVIFRAPAAMSLEPGDTIGVTIPPEHVYLFDPETGETLKSKSAEAATESPVPVTDVGDEL